MAKISREARAELVSAVGARYRGSNRGDKTRILDEFVRVTGDHRKHAVRVLQGKAEGEKPRSSPRPTLYDEATRQSLVVLWEASDRICGKRLRPLLPLLITSLERHGHLQLDEGVREKLLRVSASTMDRLLAAARAGSKKRRRKPPAVQSQIPVRTFADWDDPLPGFMEADLVAHCGGIVSSFCVSATRRNSPPQSTIGPSAFVRAGVQRHVITTACRPECASQDSGCAYTARRDLWASMLGTRRRNRAMPNTALSHHMEAESMNLSDRRQGQSLAGTHKSIAAYKSSVSSAAAAAGRLLHDMARPKPRLASQTIAMLVRPRTVESDNSIPAAWAMVRT